MGDPISVIASPIVELAVEKLATLVHDEYLTLAGFEEAVKRLENTLTDIHKVLEIAEKGPREFEVIHLLKDLKDAAHDAENVLDMISTEALLWNEKQLVRFVPSGANKWIFRWKNRSTPNKINEIMKTLISIHERFSAMENLLQHVKEESSGKEKEEENPTVTVSPVSQSEVVGRGEEKNKIIEMLISDRQCVEGRVFWTPITGMGGIGKTTLAQLVYNDKEVTQHFDKKIWVPVSNRKWEVNHVKILETIKNACGKDLLQASLEEVVEHSVQDLKLLTVLDDVWSEDFKDWKNLEKVLLKADKGTRVIVTSRTLNVFGFSPENVSIPNTQLEELPHEECLELFAKNAVDEDVSTLKSKGVMTIADKIVQKCGGLPLAVEVIGCLLITKPLEKWNDILNYDLAKFEEDEYRERRHRRTLPVLRLSYFNLSPRLKQCFSFCSIFPKGHQFDKDELVKLWMAHSLIQPSKSAESLEDKGRQYFDRLRVLSFFQQQPDSEIYRMHDYIHELAELVSAKYSCILKDGRDEIDPQIHHISLLFDKVEERANAISNCSRLRTFLIPQPCYPLRNFGETLGKMLHALKYLRVLDLSSSRLSQLPKTIAELKLLCYLNLSRTEIKYLPNALCSLRNLQTLKLIECPWFSTLPKGLSRLIKLWHLEIDDAFWKYRCITQPPNIGRLTCLENLHKFRVGESGKGSGIEELKDMNALHGSLHIMELNSATHAAEAKMKDKQRLQVLELEWVTERDISQPQAQAVDDYDAQVLEDLEPHSSLIELKVHNYWGKGTPSWLSRGQLQFLKTLCLEGCKNLEALTLGGHPNIEMECPSLYTLKISNCPQLMQLPNSIPGLGVLKIKKCSSLKTIPQLVYPEILKLVDNPVLEGFHDGFPVLDDLGAIIWRCKIIGCPNFRGYPAKYNSSKHTINRKLDIGECDSSCITPRHPLTELMIDTCHKDTFLEAMEIISEFDFEILNKNDV